MRHAGRVKMAAGADYGFTTTRTTPGAGKRFGRAQTWAMTLCLVLCFVLGAAFYSKAQGIESSDAGPQPAEVSTSAVPDFKKIWLPYFLRYNDVYSLEDILLDDFSVLFEKYEYGDTSLFAAYVRNAGVENGRRLLRLIWNLDFYLLWRVEPAQRPLAWLAISEALERLLCNQVVCLGENVAFLESIARQRREFPPQSTSGYAAAEELQRPITHYHMLEANYAEAVGIVKADRVAALQMLPPEVRRAFSGSGVALDDAPDGAGLLAKVRLARQDLAGQTEELIARGAGEGGRNSLASHMLLVYMEIDDALRTSEICARASLEQLLMNKNLPLKYKEVADAAVKNIITLYMDYILESFDIKIRALKGVDNEYRARGEDGGYYILRQLAIYKRTYSLVEELRQLIAGNKS